jgi:hypothetical protein
VIDTPASIAIAVLLAVSAACFIAAELFRRSIARGVSWP